MNGRRKCITHADILDPSIAPLNNTLHVLRHLAQVQAMRILTLSHFNRLINVYKYLTHFVAKDKTYPHFLLDSLTNVNVASSERKKERNGH